MTTSSKGFFEIESIDPKNYLVARRLLSLGWPDLLEPFQKVALYALIKS